MGWRSGLSEGPYMAGVDIHIHIQSVQSFSKTKHCPQGYNACDRGLVDRENEGYFSPLGTLNASASYSKGYP